jgi:signal transduction histidine kinase
MPIEPAKRRLLREPEMQGRRSIQLPIILAVVMILLLSALTVGWVVLAVRSALRAAGSAGAYWAILTVGATFFAIIVAGVVVYTTLSVKAIRLNQRQSNFIDSVTHELKSPIASLKLYLQTLSRRELDPDEQQKFYRDMLEDLNRLDQLINHLLDVARLDRPRRYDPPQAIAADQLLADCAQRLATRYGYAPSLIELELEPAMVLASPVDLELIFRNLIDNAIKYAGDPPRVRVQLKVEDSWAVVRVTDNGRGIPKHLRRKVFGRFMRVGEELQRERPGTGLGLYIVHTMVRRLRGRIRLGSGPAGQGTSLYLTLPLAASSGDMSSSSRNESTAAAEPAARVPS